MPLDGPGAIGNRKNVLFVVALSNVFLFLGGLSLAIFTYRDMMLMDCEWCDRRDFIAFLLYGLAAGFFFVSGSIQLVLDLNWLAGWASWRRPTGMGRYSEAHNSWNLVITILFLAGVVADIVAFVYWTVGKVGVATERRIQWFSSHLWLVASILALVLNCKRNKALEDKLDTAGNYSFLCESITNVLARYIIAATGDDRTELNLELAAAIFWTASAFFYVCGDILRLREDDRTRARSTSPQNPPIEPLEA